MQEFFRKLFRFRHPEVKRQALPRVPVEEGSSSNMQELALDELQRLAEIIARHEKHAFTVKAFLAAVITGLATVVYSRDVAEAVMTPYEIGMVGVGAVVAFWTWATAHRVLAGKAIDRTREIEDRLCSDKGIATYDGPSASYAMAQNTSLSDWKESGFYTTHALPFYISIFAVLVLTYADIKRVDNQKAMDEASYIAKTVVRNSKFPEIKDYGKCQALFKVDRENTKEGNAKLVLDSVSCEMQ